MRGGFGGAVRLVKEQERIGFRRYDAASWVMGVVFFSVRGRARSKREVIAGANQPRQCRWWMGNRSIRPGLSARPGWDGGVLSPPGQNRTFLIG